jgi:hypothetical protein
MPSLFCFILWSYCACARLISRQSSLFIFGAYLHFLFMFHSVVLLRMRQAHSVSFRGGGAPQPVTSCSEHGSSFYHAGSGLNMRKK